MRICHGDDMVEKLYKKSEMKKFKEMKESELEKEYNEVNLVMSKVQAQIHIGAPVGKVMHREYEQAKTKRARILTVLNQRRYERMQKIMFKKQGNAKKVLK
jgi:hypothetical protein